MIRLDVLNRAGPAIGPSDLHGVGLRRAAKPEVPARVLLGKVAGPALHQSSLNQLAGAHRHLSADGGGIRPGTLQPNNQPVAGVGGLVAQDLRAAVQIGDDDINAAVVVEIPRCDTAADALRR